MKKVFKNLRELQALGLNNFKINFGTKDEKISNLNFFQDSTSKVFTSKMEAIDLRGTDVHAGLNINTDPVSKNNAVVLNNLENLRLLIEDNAFFDFSNLQTMINRFGSYVSFTCGFTGGSTGMRTYL